MTDEIGNDAELTDEALGGVSGGGDYGQLIREGYQKKCGGLTPHFYPCARDKCPVCGSEVYTLVSNNTR